MSWYQRLHDKEVVLALALSGGLGLQVVVNLDYLGHGQDRVSWKTLKQTCNVSPEISFKTKKKSLTT